MSDLPFNDISWIKSIKKSFGLQLPVLKVLEASFREKKQQSAYDIQNEIYRLTFSLWKPSPGSIYPILETLLENKQVQLEKRDNKDFYSITETGRKSLEHFLSIKLLSNVFIDSKLYDTFEPESIIFPGTTHLVHDQFTSLISVLAEKEGIELEKIQDHIIGIEKTILKERMREIITGIDKKIQLLEYIKMELEKRMGK
ncbi:MAG: PadR family transcriptional regulator [Candidatus Heimdallarchaeota archaeon]